MGFLDKLLGRGKRAAGQKDEPVHEHEHGEGREHEHEAGEPPAERPWEPPAASPPPPSEE